MFVSSALERERRTRATARRLLREFHLSPSPAPTRESSLSWAAPAAGKVAAHLGRVVCVRVLPIASPIIGRSPERYSLFLSPDSAAFADAAAAKPRGCRCCVHHVCRWDKRRVISTRRPRHWPQERRRRPHGGWKAPLLRPSRHHLRRRGVGEPTASLTAEAGIAAFKIAFERWVTETDQRGLPQLIRESLDELKALTAAT